jgi:hypothetical protein
VSTKLLGFGLHADEETSSPARAAKNFVKELFLGRGLASRALADLLDSASFNLWTDSL